ncbi:phage portal protein [Bacillus thuringiensis]|uniref:Phage-related head portal protein n=2 Tax=Bacillus thuringiensis TaxID=1428 RepID=A0A9W3P0U4_BACTU|nr:phage portal protein [Bacillus thuringiensis]EEM40360.1 Phage-related, head portal protein [Bacillus thuringiensis serovar sotto str. T04001]AFQ19399.1 phage-related head portal protein [Bacillus thuringiensis HD-771]MEB4893909.1 phage portal protein [Bacillus thuringiensis]MEC2472783.1 phage portal protein [Bacillus thuringiensis]MEC2564891.1 phage portal protein [Bacillus thuringiensis]
MAVSGAVAGWKGQTYDFSSWLGRTFWGVDNSKLANNETIFSVVSRLSNIIASLPIKMYKNYDLENNSASDVLINGPNQNMTSFDLIRNMETARNENGNTYALIERDIRGQVSRISPLISTYVEPVLEQESKELWYQVVGDGGTYYFHNLDVLHLKHIVSSQGLKGINPIKVLTNTIDFDKAIREFSLKEMQSAPNSFIVTYGANIDKDKRKEVIEDFKRFYQDNGGILFQEPGVTIDQLERKYIAADTFTSERITRSRVANVFNVPVTFLNDNEGQSYGSNEQLMQQFVQLTLMPIIRQYEQEFNRKLLTPAERKAGFYFKFNVGALLRGDTTARNTLYHGGLRDGWLTRNDVRRWEDLPPIPGKADELWISGDMYPLDMDPSERKGVSTNGKQTNE